MRLPPPELLLAPDESLLLTGSYARGEADEWSDIDLWVIRSEVRSPQTLYSAGRLHVVSYYRLPDLLDQLRSPGSAPFVVPALRQAQIILDPSGQAATLKDAAHSWTWDLIEPLTPDWLGTQMMGMIEDAHKVRAAITTSDWDRGYDPLQVLIFGCTEAMIVSMRLLPETQNRYFTSIRTALGVDHRWSQALDCATGISGPIHIQDCLGAGIELYASTVRHLQHDLQPGVVQKLEIALNRCCR